MAATSSEHPQAGDVEDGDGEAGSSGLSGGGGDGSGDDGRGGGGGDGSGEDGRGGGGGDGSGEDGRGGGGGGGASGGGGGASGGGVVGGALVSTYATWVGAVTARPLRLATAAVRVLEILLALTTLTWFCTVLLWSCNHL